jgi:hypothetical protein
MGWNVYHGPDKMPSFYPAAQLRKSMYRPDVIKMLLKTGSLQRALEAADKARGAASKAVRIDEVLPPTVLLTTPDQSPFTTTEPTVEIRAAARPAAKNPITAMRLLMNGRPYHEADGLRTFNPPMVGEVRQAWKVQLAPGQHEFAVLAESAVSKAVSEPVEVISGMRGIKPIKGQAAPEAVELPTLYVLSVGISAYKGALKLDYAAKDATVLSQVLQARSKTLYRKIEVKLLTDKGATHRSILQGLTWLRKEMTQRDVAVLSFAGHGDQDADGHFYLLPVNVDADDLLSTAGSGEQMKSVLGGLPGKVLVFLDGCHSGAVDGERKRSRTGLSDNLVRDLVTDDYGVVIMCSATGK